MTNRLIKTITFCGCLAGSLLTLSASAAVTLPRFFSDGMILQRDQPVVLWGWATTEKQVVVKLGEQAPVQVPVKDGKWRVELPALAAGGPVTLEVAGENRLKMTDILFGDVWIGSGQSNMELPIMRVTERYPNLISETRYPMVRQFLVPRGYRFDAPAKDFPDGSWEAATPENLAQFSAVGFFFAQALHEQYSVPVGIILSAYGGAPAEGWMSAGALRAFPHYHKTAMQLAQPGYLEKIQREDAEQNSAWYDSLNKRDPGLHAEKPWSDPATSLDGWKRVQVPGFWDDTGVGEFDGVVWYQKEFVVPEKHAGKPAELSIGTIVDADTAWINGKQVGTTAYQYPPRRYAVAEGILRAGTNLLTVRVINSNGKGGFLKDKPYWISVGDFQQNLEGEWLYRIGAKSEPLPPPVFQDYRNPLGFYNAMLAPLLNLKIKGVIWYQGETNTGNPAEYRTLFPAMIRDWRQQWGIGNFPFLFVQLANFMETQPLPVESNWAATREAQRLALSEPNTGMAVAIDVGEWNDIHPTDKKTVGERLALAARKVAYGETGLMASGPTPRSLTVKGSTAIVQFDYVDDGLVARGGKLAGFAIAGENGEFVWANAKIKGSTVELKHRSVKQPVRVRYAWADNPADANLYNKAGLPAVPFELIAEEPQPVDH